VVGEEIRGMKVRHMDEIATLRPAERPAIGVITTPAWAAQQVADLLVQVGVTSLLNFAPRVLTVPPQVHLRYVDLSVELQVLGFYRARPHGPDRIAAADSDRVPLIRAVGTSAPAAPL
jgi:redox-sensing transcriptional repressor